MTLDSMNSQTESDSDLLNSVPALEGASIEQINKDLYRRALTHKSYSNERKLGSLENNERLEFLGDAVLELTITELLMNEFPDDAEGVLSNKRSQLVNEASLASLAESLGISEKILLGRGEQVTDGHLKPRLLASALEAIFGAIYQDAGFESAQSYIKDLFQQRIKNLSDHEHDHKDFKTKFQELVQKSYQVTPSYRLTKTEGPEHDKIFFVTVSVNGKELASGEGRSKKEAQQKAAESALEELAK